MLEEAREDNKDNDAEYMKPSSKASCKIFQLLTGSMLIASAEFVCMCIAAEFGASAGNSTQFLGASPIYTSVTD